MKKATKKKIVWKFKRAVHCLFLLTFLCTYGLHLRIKYRLRFTEGSVHNQKGPYLLIGNHTHSHDGVFFQELLPKLLHFVVTDTVFKKAWLRKLLDIVNYVPKKKFVSDVKAIKKIVTITKYGGIVGIFPEGRRSWDGKTVHIPESTYKLVRMLKVPVVTAKIKGGYLSWPRWAYSQRRGRVEIEMKTLISAEELAKMSIEQIGDKIQKELDHDEMAWQREKMIPFKGERLAEGIEHVLYTCPHCKSLGTLRSKDDAFWCVDCGSRYLYDVYGFIHSINGDLPSDSVSELNIWQRKQLNEYIDAASSNEIYLSEQDGHLLTTDNTEDPLREIDSGTLELTSDTLSIGGRSFDLPEVYGVAVYFKKHLNFRYRSCDYRVSFDTDHISYYKWYSAIKFVIEKLEEA